jgi:hypothetical protein
MMTRFDARGHAGSATVEFTLVLPLLLVLALATVEVALLVKDQLIVQGAARAGAREAAVTLDDGSVRQAVFDAAPGADESLFDIEIDRGDESFGEVTVHVTYHDPVVVSAVGWLFPDTVDLSAGAVMRKETG